MRTMPIHPRHRQWWLQLGLILLVVATCVFRGVIRADTSSEADQPTVILVMGAAGAPEFGSNFVHQVEAWKRTIDRASATGLIVGEESVDEVTDREILQNLLQAEPRDGSQALWLVLMGHGTFDGKVARFNMRGPDISSAELADWLQPFTRPLVVINTASASAPYLSALSGTNRVIVTATRSGDEQSFTWFGQNLAEAFGEPESDLDQDDQVSLLEAFLVASAQVEEFYDTEGRLAGEHAILDDNGDKKGTPAEWFHGVRAIKSAKKGATVDGARAHQLHLVLSPTEQALSSETRATRDALELSVADLRNRKSELGEMDYYQELEILLLKLARVYRSNGSAEVEPARQ